MKPAFQVIHTHVLRLPLLPSWHAVNWGFDLFRSSGLQSVTCWVILIFLQKCLHGPAAGYRNSCKVFMQMFAGQRRSPERLLFGVHAECWEMEVMLQADVWTVIQTSLLDVVKYSATRWRHGQEPSSWVETLKHTSEHSSTQIHTSMDTSVPADTLETCVLHSNTLTLKNTEVSAEMNKLTVNYQKIFIKIFQLIHKAKLSKLLCLHFFSF